MRLLQFLAVLLLLSVPVLAQDWRAVRSGPDLPWVATGLLAEAKARKPGASEAALSALTALSTVNPTDAYERAEAAQVLARGAVFFTNANLAARAESLLDVFPPWLTRYDQFVTAAEFKEPAWLNGQAEAVAQAVLAWCALEQFQSVPARRDLIAKFGQGLHLCGHKDPNQYPFRAHTCFAPQREGQPLYAPIPTGGQAPGAMWVPGRSRQVEALVAASTMGSPGLIDSATTEALGIWSSLATSGRMPTQFSPRPEGEGPATGDAVLVSNFLSLFRATENPLYAALAGIGSLRTRGQAGKTPAEQAALVTLALQLENTPAAAYTTAKDVSPPTTYWIMEAEDGKAVKKAFEAFDVTYPAGTPGKMARVGGGDMFWMRFDVEKEGDYDFYLVFVKSPLEGGLVSIRMRIDGDKIFEVPFGGASESYVDLEFVEGPRFLRTGPHSFGIRFSGLLMTQPAILDCVIAWPTVERRHLQLPDGRQLLLLHSHAPEAAKTAFTDGIKWPPTWIQSVDGTGKQANLERMSDKRRHKEYLLVPPAGTSLLEWRP